MFTGLAIASTEDILAIHRVVSDELKTQIEAACPELFDPKQYDFTDYHDEFDNSNLPFFVGRGLCTNDEDMSKCLIVRSGYTAEAEFQDNGYQIIRFIKEK